MKQKVVVVEDDLPICEMYEFKLKKAGYDVKVAHNGADGENLIKLFQPELILLDLKMPIMTGDEMLERVRATEWGAKLRVIVLTNISRDEAPHKLRFLNVDRYIVKAHHTPQQIIDIVKELI